MTASVTLAFLGDLMLGRRVSKLLPNKPPEWIWGDVLPVLRRADAVLANLECPITSHDLPWSKTWKAFHFRAVPEAVSLLQCANVRFVSLANNHILDFNASGLFDTLRHLDEAGILHAGAGRNAEEAAAPALLDLPHLRAGVIAATDTMRSFQSGPQRPGTNFIDIGSRSPALEQIAASVKTLLHGGAGLIILSLHWGPNMRRRPRERFRQFARAAIEVGVNIVHGHSAHVFQGIECYKGGAILYDTGNFIDDHWNFWNFGGYWNFPFRHDDWSFVFLADVAQRRLTRFRLIPVRTRPWPLSLAVGKAHGAITRRMESLSLPDGTQFLRTAEGLEIPVPQ